MSRYILTEYTPEGNAINTYHDTEVEARAALAAKAGRYQLLPLLEAVTMRIWVSTNRGYGSRTIAEQTVPAGEVKA